MGNEALPLFDDDAVAGVQVRVTGTIDTPAGKVRHLGDEVIMLTIGSVVRVVHLNVDAYHDAMAIMGAARAAVK